MKKIIKNQDRINNFIDKLTKNTSSKVNQWINLHFKHYLFNEYSNFKVLEESQSSMTIHIVLSKQMKNEIQTIINWIENNDSKYIEALDYAYEEVLKFTKFENLISYLGTNFFLTEVKCLREKSRILSSFKNASQLASSKLWNILDSQGNILACIPYENQTQWNGTQIFYSYNFFFHGFPKEALREFYRFSRKYLKNCVLDERISNFEYTNLITNEILPLSLWEDNGILNHDLDLSLQNNIELPKGLIIKGDLDITRSSISYLGNDLKVKGNVRAVSSQLAVVDDSVTIGGNLYSEDSLLMSYSNKIRKKIINPKKLQQVITDF